MTWPAMHTNCKIRDYYCRLASDYDLSFYFYTKNTRDNCRWVGQLTKRGHPGPLEGTQKTSFSKLLNFSMETIQGHWKDTRDIYRWVDQLTNGGHPGPLEGSLETFLGELLNLPIKAIQGHWKDTRDICRWVPKLTNRGHPGPLEGPGRYPIHNPL